MSYGIKSGVTVYSRQLGISRATEHTVVNYCIQSGVGACCRVRAYNRELLQSFVNDCSSVK